MRNVHRWAGHHVDGALQGVRAAGQLPNSLPRRITVGPVLFVAACGNQMSVAPNAKPAIRRIELTSKRGQSGEFKCLVCGRILEVLDGSTEVAYRLTVQPSKIACDEILLSITLSGCAGLRRSLSFSLRSRLWCEGSPTVLCLDRPRQCRR